MKMKIRVGQQVFGTSAFALDGEMGPYPLDGEMGPYPLSDNTNLLSASSYGMSLYRNYGSSYGTNYATCNLYTAKYSNKQKAYATTSATSNLNSAHAGYGNNAETDTCKRAHCSASTVTHKKCRTPVPARRKRERDSFRRHSIHGRMSTAQGILFNKKKQKTTKKKKKNFSVLFLVFIHRKIPKTKHIDTNTHTQTHPSKPIVQRPHLTSNNTQKLISYPSDQMPRQINLSLSNQSIHILVY